MNMRTTNHPATVPGGARDIDDALDEALDESFPASDPIAVSIANSPARPIISLKWIKMRCLAQANPLPLRTSET
jgi:hypothetical protein